jgi:hypothetical protein
MPVDPREAEDRRRAARAGWSVARYRLGDEPGDDVSDVTTPAQRIAMMWELAESAWKAAGRALPTYDRRSIPCRLFRPGDPRPDADDA